MIEFLLQASWWIPIYGLIGAVLTLPWSTGLIRRTGPRPAAYFNLLMTVAAFAHGSVIYRATWDLPRQQITIQWLDAAGLDLSFLLEISPVSLGAVELVTGISLVAQLYALGYMEKDWATARFFGLMGFFEAAVSGLALSDSLLLSYILLELLTLSTYLLVGFWYAQPLVVTAARDAFLTKRVGDVLLLMGVVYLSTVAGSLNFSDLELWSETHNLPPLTAALLGLALIAGPIGKCAQFPLHLWLDEAMEGPNPASLLRNSVVVAGGAYVLIKLQPILSLSPVVSDTLMVLGTVTAVGASLVAIAQIQQLRPQIRVFRPLFLIATPAVISPLFSPPLADGIHHIFRIRVQRHRTAIFQGFQSGDRGHDFHPVIRRPPEPAAQLPPVRAGHQNRPVSPPSRIPATGPIRVNRHLRQACIHYRFPRCCAIRDDIRRS